MDRCHSSGFLPNGSGNGHADLHVINEPTQARPHAWSHLCTLWTHPVRLAQFNHHLHVPFSFLPGIGLGHQQSWPALVGSIA
jgi:hypothetical protein